MSSSSKILNSRLIGAVFTLIFSGLLLAACGETTTGPSVLPTAAVTSTTAAATTASTATSTANGGATPTSVPPTPEASLPPETTPAVPATTVPATNPKVTSPQQPASGPGGEDYPYKSVTSYRYGQGVETYYLYEPTDPKPANPLPVIAFLHGYAGVDPNGYAAWITHLVRRGNIVIFPVYQERNSTDGTEYTDSALASLKAALQELQSGKHVKSDLTNFSIIGYSAGGVIATNLTARATKEGLPIPKSLMAVSPGGCANCSILAVKNFTLDPATELATILASTRMLLLVGNQDIIVGKSAAELIWQDTSQIPAANKNYLEFDTDNYGQPGLVADHGMATRHNAFNYLGIWKLYDGLESCSISGTLCDVALGGTPQQLSLGNWSDGRPVNPIKVLG